MMPFYAPFGPYNPYINKRPNNYYPHYNNLHNDNLNSNNLKEKPCFPSVSSKKEQGNSACSSNTSNTTNFNTDFSKKEAILDDLNNNDDNFFEIFGLKLAFDDLLIIAMLFFLYKEEVNDTYLYIALILLLLT